MLYTGGKRPINQSDLTSQGVIIPYDLGEAIPSNYNTHDFICYGVEQFLQNAIDSGQERFQVRIQFTGNITDNDGQADGWRFEQENTSLKFIQIINFSSNSENLNIF